MEALYGEGGAGGQRGAVVAARTAWERRVQTWLDQSVPHTGPRWGAFAVVVLFYIVRVYLLQGFYIVTYGIAIFNLNLAIGFLSPAFDPEEQDGPTLPTTEKEFKPFVRRVPEFKFWCAAAGAARARANSIGQRVCAAATPALPRRRRRSTRRRARTAACPAAHRRRMGLRHAAPRLCRSATDAAGAARRCAAGSTPSSRFSLALR
jgi:hypothetical protein